MCDTDLISASFALMISKFIPDIKLPDFPLLLCKYDLGDFTSQVVAQHHKQK